MIQVEEFVTDEDVSPFRRWFDALDDQAAAWIAVAIDRLGEGNTSNAKAVGEGVSELRINRGPGYRIYFGWDGQAPRHLARWRHQTAAAERYPDGVTPLARLQSVQGGGKDKEELIMPLTRSFRETVQARAQRDVKFRQALLGEAMQALLDGNLEEGRAALRSCINATIGFEKLGTALGRSPKSLMRMFGPSGNPTTENLLAVIRVLQAKTGVRLQVRTVADAA
jgi:putative addiction module killer protein